MTIKDLKNNDTVIAVIITLVICVITVTYRLLTKPEPIHKPVYVGYVIINNHRFNKLYDEATNDTLFPHAGQMNDSTECPECKVIINNYLDSCRNKRVETVVKYLNIKGNIKYTIVK